MNEYDVETTFLSQKDKGDRMRSTGSIELYMRNECSRFPFAYLLPSDSDFYCERRTNCPKELHDAQSRRGSKPDQNTEIVDEVVTI